MQIIPNKLSLLGQEVKSPSETFPLRNMSSFPLVSIYYKYKLTNSEKNSAEVVLGAFQKLNTVIRFSKILGAIVNTYKMISRDLL